MSDSNWGHCTFCRQTITDYEFVHNEETGVKLHTKCKDDYLRRENGTCAQCNEILIGEVVRISSAPGKTFHADGCLDEYKRSTRPDCVRCNQIIMDEDYVHLNNDGDYASERTTYHQRCFDDLNREKGGKAAALSVGDCYICKDPIKDQEYVTSQQSGAKMHNRCKEEYLRQKNGECAHCHRALFGEILKLPSADREGSNNAFHKDCIDLWKQKNRPQCYKCKQTIMDDSYYTNPNCDKCDYHIPCFQGEQQPQKVVAPVPQPKKRGSVSLRGHAHQNNSSSVK